MSKILNRCKWVNMNNPLYIRYHDEEWGVPQNLDKILFELLILESFQTGLSWECILNKRENFRAAYDNFDIEKISQYDKNKLQKLLLNSSIIRNRLKIKASIANAKIFLKIQAKYGSFDNYIWGVTDRKVVYESYDIRTTFLLSDRISKDLKKRGMKFVGSTVIYSYLQVIGIINGHGIECDCNKKDDTSKK